MTAEVIVSAGGVVYARRAGRLMIALIEDHRGRLGLPKGKREAGESLEETALREIWEEAGIEGRIIQSLITVRYRYFHSKRGRVEKEVHYFLVEKMTDAANPNSECDLGVIWMDAARAGEVAGDPEFGANRRVLRRALRALGVWTGEDDPPPFPPAKPAPPLPPPS
jgi:8-oxo-dGTP pyrophosphatase MutT (NUDIX family)